jgi:hypothetical protein
VVSSSYSYMCSVCDAQPPPWFTFSFKFWISPETYSNPGLPDAGRTETSVKFQGTISL